VRCASTGAERRGGGLCADPAYVVIPQAKNKQTRNKKAIQAKNNRPTSLLFPPLFFRCPLRRLWAVCGHATACGHPQLAVGSSFTS
jgi:hypothetical protein